MSSSKLFDYIVLGSGCAGAMAAQSLQEAGKEVAIIDVGETNPNYSSLVPNKPFLELRKTDPKQYKYFIGENCQGVIADDTSKGAQITPPRSYMLRDTDKFIPLSSDTFVPIESLGYGGLGIGWGLQCWEFSGRELDKAGLDKARMFASYNEVARRIGISGTKDAAADYTLGKLNNYAPSPTMDSNMARIADNYARRQAHYAQQGFYLGRTPLALLTKAQNNRQAYAYRDMDFYDDNGESAWRPWVTINRLRTAANVTYIGDFLALSYQDEKDHVAIIGRDVKTKKPTRYRCRTLVMACGALGSARIALRSAKTPGSKTSFLCNPYTYVPSLQPSFVGRAAAEGRIGFGQLSGFLSEEATNEHSSIMTLYSYQSLMLFRVIRQAPLDFADSRRLMQYLASGIIVNGIQHSDAITAAKWLQLAPNKATYTGDELRAHYQLDNDTIADQRRRESRYLRYLRRLGVYPLKRFNPGHGSSVHYAGTLPYSTTEKPLTLSPSGRLHGTRHVYVADSSGFNFLPARGLTFSLMANAIITTENILKNRV